ncbi:DnaJ domain-containing protein [Catenaria anguillulae PL171]|uniref:DnaJ domain-containing protein n=1 Tax=Catenaria anguillulae PL171 TaxID=765915 RepID=A0A1Y2I0E9_9FUNG|nr:DnaJ domain-containing protein [Catenaria anguillulae PL171]
MPAPQRAASPPAAVATGGKPSVTPSAKPASRSDYYVALNIPKCADPQEVRTAFRRLVLRHHPDRTKEPGAVETYKIICEAFDVLHNPETRAIYDLFGHDGLEHGIPEQSNKPGYPGYKYHGDPNRTFHEFFGGDNVFFEVFKGHLYDPATGNQRVGYGSLRPEQVKQPTIEQTLDVTLEEVYMGVTKKVPWTRMVMESGQASDKRVRKSELLSVVIPAGTRSGTKLVFPEQGDQAPNTVPSDLVFVVNVLPHKTYSRDAKNNLVYTYKLPLKDALAGTTIRLKALDGRDLTVPVFEVVNPFYVKCVEGEGMPNVRTPEDIANGIAPTKANLLIRFQVDFPTYLGPKQKKTIHEALSEGSDPSPSAK